jgi:lipid-A-disaccharide kinase (EC 2.7.1.130)
VVGNLSVGGTGKTPQIEYLIRLLSAVKKVAVLSRGYKRETKGFRLLNAKSTAAAVGDEPLQFFKKFKSIFVAVDANRVHGVRQLQTQCQPDVVLLDDAYQHRKIKAHYYVLLTKYSHLFVDDFLLPTGNLRESKSGAARANVIVVTKCPQELTKTEQDLIKTKLKRYNKPVYFTSIAYANYIVGASAQRRIKSILKSAVLLITGIANPQPLVAHCKALGLTITHLNYPDHYNFKEKDLLKIKATFSKLQDNALILTTEKDYMRLAGKLNSLYYLPIETRFLNEDSKTVFNTSILNLFNAN